MWHFVKHLPVEWFPRDFPCTPRGPNIRRARPVTIRIAGSELHIRVPRHNPSSSSMQQYNLFLGRDALAQGLFSARGREPMVNDHWGFASALTRRWAFWGPWMSGCKAELHFGITVVGRLPGHEFPNTSFFHPRAFETAITQYLNDRYGHNRWGSSEDDPRSRHMGPFDWQTHNHLPVFSASCKICDTARDGKTLRIDLFERLFFFPVTERHFVRMSFHQYLYAYDAQGNITFDPSPVQALQDAVFNSMTLELSSEAQASYDKVKAECPDMRLTETFPPLNWPTEAATRGEDLTPNPQDNAQLAHGR